MVTLTGTSLTLEEVARVARSAEAAVLSEESRGRVRAGEALLARLIEGGTPIYGITTGFGALDQRTIRAEDNVAQQRNLLRSHAAGMGTPMAEEAVRAMMLIRANVLASGATGVRLGTLEALLAMLDRGVVPEVPELGSVGACGDLPPLAHMALPLIGEGRATLGGRVLPGAEAMRQAGIALPDLGGRDGLALINGTEQTTAIGALALLDAEALAEVANLTAALTMEALGALSDAFDERVAELKPHPGQVAVSANLRRLTAGSRSVLRPRPSRLRDALSVRCVPHVHGAARAAMEGARATLTIEINAANDNPLFGLADGWVTSNAGNFHGQQAGVALDRLADALTSLAVISERRSARLIDPQHNGGLPAFLIHPEAAPGVNSGLMLAQYTAAALVAELRMRAIPATIQSIPTCAGTEDHVPMAPLAARRAAFAVATLRRVLAVELLLAAQAIDLRGLAPAPALLPAFRAIRARVPVMVEDRVLAEDLRAIEHLLRSGAIAA